MERTKVICGGAFNKLHKGHEFFLREAKKLGYLIVMISHDKINEKKPGERVPAVERKKAVEKLGIADKVLIGDSSNRMKIVEEEKPNVIVLGYDQEMTELKNFKGIKIVRINKNE